VNKEDPTSASQDQICTRVPASKSERKNSPVPAEMSNEVEINEEGEAKSPLAKA